MSKPTSICPAPLRGRAKCLILLLPLMVLAGSCSGLGQRPAETGPVQGSGPTRQLPDVELSAQLTYDVLLGEIARQRGHLEVATDALVRAARESRDPRLVERATRLAVHAKRNRKALEAARLWAELEPDLPQPHETVGALLLALDQPGPAREHFLRALALQEKNLGAAYTRLGEILRKVGDGDESLALMEELVALHPNNAEAYLALARLAGARQKKAQAIGAYRRALNLRPAWEEAAVHYARFLVGEQDHAGLKKFCTRFLDGHPTAKRLRLTYARYLLDQGEQDRAREQFTALVEHDPQDADAVYAVGLLAIQAKQYEQAERYLERVLKLNPDNDQARLYLGQIAQDQGDFDKAVERYRSIDSGQYLFEAQLRMAAAIAGGGDVTAARAHLAALEPAAERQQVQIVLTEEQILREQDDPDTALEVVDRGLERFPGNTDLLYARALLAAQLNMLEEHERDIRQVLAKEPKNAHALNALGYTLADQTDRYQEALGLIKRALAIRPDDPYILDSMGWVNYRMGRHAVAVKFLRRAYAKRADAEIGAHLGEVLWVQGKRKQARSVWQRALKAAPDNEVLLKTLKRFEQ